MSSPFIHLHAHSHYSLLEALPQIDPLIARAKLDGMDALALTDYGGMYGTIEFYKACKKDGIKPIIGVCMYVAKKLMTDKRPRIDDRNHQITLIAETFEGYQNLMKLVTISHLEGFYYKPRIDKEMLRKYRNGIIALSGNSRGEINTHLKDGNTEAANAAAKEYQDIFGANNFFIEIIHQPDSEDYLERRNQLVEIGKTHNISIVATRDIHYLNTDDAEAHDVQICIGIGKTVDEGDHRRKLGTDLSFVSSANMVKAFADFPEAIANTRLIADRVNVEIPLGKWNFANYPIPEGKTFDEVLREETVAGTIAKHGTVSKEVEERINYELNIIFTKGYSPYFLVVSDYVRWAKAQGIVVTTRGSAAGSFVSYALDIVSVDPLVYKLPFERFLTVFRPTPPDIDVDFADLRRDEVIEYTKQKYGADKVAQIGTFGTMAARAAVRDVGRALGYAYALCDKVSKLIPLGSQGFHMTIDRALVESPDLAELYKTDAQVYRLIELSKKLEGSARHVSVHAAGVVISPHPLTEYTPLQRESGGDKIITQYDMYSVEDAGVLKMDFLGIRNLSILGNSVEIVKKTKGVTVDLNNLPFDDKITYELLARGDTVGLFQLNGAAMTKYLKDLRPSQITDIMAMVALYRPGPMESIPEFIRRKHNPSLVTYLDPRLKEILSMSYGIITYQDDVLLTAIHIAGYSWEEADKLRKAMGKKIPAEMMAQKDKFINGSIKNGLTSEKAQELWHLIEPFAAYGFNKAHSACYGIVAYQTAYMKAHFGAEFMAAVLTAEAGDADTVAEIVDECEKIGIKVMPPEINSSGSDFTYIDDHNIRFGILAIKNVGTEFVNALIFEREAHGPFKNLADLAVRMNNRHFNKKALESLIKTGALDAFGERNQMMLGIEQILSFHKTAMKEQDSKQSTLFLGSSLQEVVPELVLRDAPVATKREKLMWEKELLGLYVSDHPFREYAEYFGASLSPLSKIQELKTVSASMILGGIISTFKKIMTKKGAEMAFMDIEDEFDSIEVVVFPKTFEKYKTVLNPDAPILIQGKFEEKDGEPKIILEQVYELKKDNLQNLKDILKMSSGDRSHQSGSKESAEAMQDSAEIGILVPKTMPQAFADELKKVFVEYPGNRHVVLVVDDVGGRKKIPTSFSISFSGDSVKAIENLVGRNSIVNMDVKV